MQRIERTHKQNTYH